MARSILSRKPQPVRRTVGYVRVSTDDQARGGVSLAAQEDRIRAFCFATDRRLDEVIVDAGESAKTLNRPGMARILTELRAGSIATVVIVKLDRLTRSTRDLDVLLETFRHADASLVSVCESLDTLSASGRMVVGILGVVAQWEREAIGERTAEALARKRRERLVYGHAPFGYRREGNALVEVPAELEALETLKRMRADGETLRTCASWLTSHGFTPTQGGCVWHPQTVSTILGSRMAVA